MSKVISTTVVNPNGKEDTCAYAVVDSKELYYLLSLVTAPDKYTISFFIKSLANETLTLWYGEESKEFEVTTSWQKITWNFSAEWVDNLMLQFTEGNYYIYNTMLERGNVATDYSMSQYDQKKVLKDMENTLNTKYAQLSIALDDITLEVSETSSKLGNVESSVKLMSDEIGLKVNKNGIIGAINLSSEQAQIMASKIDLVGAVTLSSLSSDVASKFDTLDDITVTDNNITYIDGGKIYTGSITADKIDVDDLFAQEITATGTITGATLIGSRIENSWNEESLTGLLINSNLIRIGHRTSGSQTYWPYQEIGQGVIKCTYYPQGTSKVPYTIISAGGMSGGVINEDMSANEKCYIDTTYGNMTLGGNFVANKITTSSGADLDTINSNLTSGIKVNYFTLSASEYTPVTTSKVTHSTLYGRKFSDYEYLNFELIVGTLIRASYSIPRRRFGTYSVELTYADSTKAQYWVNVAFASDTSYYVQGSSNIASKTYVCITGLKALM